MTKMGIWSDVHCHEYGPYATLVDADVGPLKVRMVNSRLVECWNTIRRMQEYCAENDILQSMFLGDLFFAPTATIAESRGGRSLSIPVLHGTFVVLTESQAIPPADQYLLCGNHDFSSRHPDLNALRVFSMPAWLSLPRTVVSKPSYHLVGKPAGAKTLVWLFCMPWMPADVFPGALEALLDSWADDRMSKPRGKSVLVRKYLFMHQGIVGAKLPSGHRLQEQEGVPKDALQLDFFDRVFCGHVHKHQVLARGRIINVGSLLQHDFGDCGDERGFVVLDLERNKWEFVPVPSKKFGVVELDKQTYSDTEGGSIGGWLGDYVYVRVIVKGGDWDVDKLWQTSGVVDVVDEREQHVERRIPVERQQSVRDMVGPFVDASTTELSKPQLKKLGRKIVEEASGREKGNE